MVNMSKFVGTINKADVAKYSVKNILKPCSTEQMNAKILKSTQVMDTYIKKPTVQETDLLPLKNCKKAPLWKVILAKIFG